MKVVKKKMMTTMMMITMKNRKHLYRKDGLQVPSLKKIVEKIFLYMSSLSSVLKYLPIRYFKLSLKKHSKTVSKNLSSIMKNKSELKTCNNTRKRRKKIKILKNVFLIVFSNFKIKYLFYFCKLFFTYIFVNFFLHIFLQCIFYIHFCNVFLQYIFNNTHRLFCFKCMYTRS